MIAEEIEESKKIRFLHDFDKEKSNSSAFISNFLEENKIIIGDEVEIKGSDEFELRRVPSAVFDFILGRDINEVNRDKVNQVTKYLSSNQGDLRTIYVSEDPIIVLEVAKENPQVISFLYKSEMPDEYNKQALNLVISAVNSEDEELKKQNRQSLIVAAEEYQKLSEEVKELSSKIRKINEGVVPSNLTSIKEYVGHRVENYDWFKAVKEGLKEIVDNNKVASPKLAVEGDSKASNFFSVPLIPNLGLLPRAKEKPLDINKKIIFLHNFEDKKVKELGILGELWTNHDSSIVLINKIDQIYALKKQENSLPIFVSEKPEEVLEFAEKNPDAISFLYEKEMGVDYNKQVLGFVISAANGGDEEFKKNRELLIWAAEDYQELSALFEFGTLDKITRPKNSIKEYVGSYLEKDSTDWFKAVEEAFSELDKLSLMASPKPVSEIAGDLEINQSTESAKFRTPHRKNERRGRESMSAPVSELRNFFELRGRQNTPDLRSQKDLLEMPKDSVSKMVRNIERGGGSAEGSPRSETNSSVSRGSVEEDEKHNFSATYEKGIIKFKIKSGPEDYRENLAGSPVDPDDKFHYNRQLNDDEKNLQKANKEYISTEFSKEKEQTRILELLNQAKEFTKEKFSDALDDNFFITVMKVAAEKCGISSIKSEEEFNGVLKSLGPALDTSKYILQDGDTLYKIAKYFSAKFQSSSEDDKYFTAREGAKGEFNNAGRRLFRVCTKDNIEAFQAMQAQDAEKKLVAQPSTVEAGDQSPRSSPSSPEFHKADKEVSLLPSTIASI